MAKGVYDPSKETRFIYEFQTMKTLKKLGFWFDGSLVSDIDAQIFSIIDSELAKIESSEIKKTRARK